MFARVEIAVRPEFADPACTAFLRQLELGHPALRKKIRWARMLEVYWLDLGIPREDTIQGITEIFGDPVMRWLMTEI